MRKRVCPQCLVSNLYVKNEAGEHRNVFVTWDFEVVVAKGGESLEGFDLEIVYCLGCSWNGSPKKLNKH